MESTRETLVDFQCHLLPGLVGCPSWGETLRRIRAAVYEGVGTLIAAPQQLGAMTPPTADTIRYKVQWVQSTLAENRIPVRILPGAQLPLRGDLVDRFREGEILTLADRGRHLLVELPLQQGSLNGWLDALERESLVAVVAQAEQSPLLQHDRELTRYLAGRGCLMQISAESFSGAMGPAAQRLAEWMVVKGWAHLVATGVGRGLSSLRSAQGRIVDLVDARRAQLLCADNPAAIAEGNDPVGGCLPISNRSRVTTRSRRPA